MSFGSLARFFGNSLLNNIGSTVLFYFAVRFVLGRYTKRETIVRLTLGLLCLFFAVSTSSALGNQLRGDYKITLLQNVVPVLMFFFAACVGARQGALRNPFEGWVRVPTSIEEGRKPAEVNQQSGYIKVGVERTG